MTRIHRQEGAEGGGAPPFADFSSFRGMIREERDAARAKREAAAAEARVERETAAAEQRRLMAGVFELKLQPAEEKGKRSGVAGGELWTARARGEPRSPIANAVQSGAAAGRNRIINPRRTAIGLNGRMHIGPMRWTRSESAPSPARSQTSTSSRNGGREAVPVQMENGENEVNQIKDASLFDGTKAKFPSWKQNFLCLAKLHGLFSISTDGVDVPVADKTMSIAALQELFPRENVQKHFIA